MHYQSFKIILFLEGLNAGTKFVKMEELALPCMTILFASVPKVLQERRAKLVSSAK